MHEALKILVVVAAAEYNFLLDFLFKSILLQLH